MKLVGLISGGKDSVFNMLQCIAAGHEMVAVANIEPDKKEELDSYMYQSVGHEAVSLIAGALGLPIFRHKTKGHAVCKSKTYVGTCDDEVEDLYHLLVKVKKNIIIEGVSVGAIASDYQRTRVENVCSRLGLKCFAYLWRRDQEELLQEMIDAELDAILIKVASIGLNPEIHLGMHIKDVKPYLMDLNKKFGVNVCGEGGEYETLTLDCPLFHRLIAVIDSENIVLSNDAFAPVAFLNVKNATLESKNWGTDDPVKSLQARLNHIKSVIKDPYSYVMDCVDDVTANIFPQNPSKPLIQALPFPFDNEEKLENLGSGNLHEYWKNPGTVKSGAQIRVSLTPSLHLVDSTNSNLNYSTGWCSVGSVTGATVSDAFLCLQKHLKRINFEFSDAVLINIYIKDMMDLVNMNKVYSQYVPDVLPPARVCVGTLLPPEIGAIIIMTAHKLVSKSQKVLNAGSVSERDGMHVQSVSHWAPANIGPYSQCIRIGGIYYLAGQIPLIPGSMEILNKPIVHQCKLALRHVLRVLQAMNDNLTLSNIFQAICYVTSEEIASDIPALWSYITKNETATVSAIAVAALPKNAQLEWEVIGCSFTQPEVYEETKTVEDYSVYIKRCAYTEPFSSSLVCKISYIKRVSKAPQSSGKTLKLVTQDGLSTIIKDCVILLRADKKNIGTPLCMMKLFYKATDTSLANVLTDVIKCSMDYKIVCTAIPVVGYEDPEIFLTVTGLSFYERLFGGQKPGLYLFVRSFTFLGILRFDNGTPRFFVCLKKQSDEKIFEMID